MPRDHEADGRGVSPRTAPSHRHCAECGCDESHACLDADLLPCDWDAASLCTYCARKVPAFKPGMRVFEAARMEATETLSTRLSLVVRHSKLGRNERGLFVECDLSDNLFVPRSVFDRIASQLGNVATSLDHDRALVIATGILASCFDAEELVAEVAGLFAQKVIKPLLPERSWMLNEFQVRTWVAENKVPY